MKLTLDLIAFAMVTLLIGWVALNAAILLFSMFP